MKQFGSVIKVEANRFFTTRMLYAILPVLMICTYFSMTGIQKYNAMRTEIEEFQKNEGAIAKNYRSYTHLSKNGMRILYVPSALSIYFSSFSSDFELTARINSVSVVDIYNNRKNDNLGESGFLINFNYSSVILIMLSCIFIYSGFTIPRDLHYLSTLSSLLKKTTGSIILLTFWIRFFFLSASFLVISGCMLCIGMLFGVDFTLQDFYVFAAFSSIACIVFLVFMFAGVIVGRIRIRSTANFALFFLWLGIIAGLPSISRVIIDITSINVDSTYKVQREILDVVNKFEEKSLRDYGRFDRSKIEVGRKVINDYIDNYYKVIEGMEDVIRQQMAENVSNYNTISKLNPVSFYLQTAKAAGSCSDDNLIEFYKYSRDIKCKFLLFIVDRTYYNNPKVMVPFVKDDENLFYAQSHLPPNFWTGVFLNLFIVLVLGVVTFFVYRRDDTNAKFVIVPCVPPGEMNSNISYNRYGALYVKNDRLRDFLFKLFSGVIPGSLKAADWSLKIDDVDVFSEEFQGDFFYICRPGDIPGDIKVKNFLSFFASLGGLPSDQKESILAATELQKLMNKRFHQLEDAESFEVMFSLTRLVKRKVYLVDDILGDLGHTYALRMLKRMMEIGKNGDIILYLTHRLRAPEKMEEFNGDVDFCRGDTWLYDLKSRGLVLED